LIWLLNDKLLSIITPRFLAGFWFLQILMLSHSEHHSVGGTSISFGQFSYLRRKKSEGARRSSDLYCPIRKACKRSQKNETKCFQALNMAFLARRSLQAISLLPGMLWQYQRELWLLEILKFMRSCRIMVKDKLLKLNWLHTQIALH